MAFYLKYRPQRIEDLDLPEVRQAMKGLLQKKTLPHALLFTGIRGTGKTSSARILAKAINCKNSKGNEPCNDCDICRSITNGSSLDVIEIDAASHRGIDDIRELRERVKLAPTHLQYKVYIIDEVHMLTTEAFNALLKTLEEPPKQVIFALCTTEIQKLPDTVRSRCVKIEFRRATSKEIQAALRRVVTGESMKVDDLALAQIAQMGDGSFRDATKVLEEVSWLAEEIKVETLEKFYNFGKADVARFMVLLEQKDVQGLLSAIEVSVGQGMDVQQLTKQLLEQLHRQLLQGKFDDKAALTKREVITLIEKIAEYDRIYQNSYVPQLALELAIVDWVGGEGTSLASNPVQVTSRVITSTNRASTQSSNRPESVTRPNVTRRQVSASKPVSSKPVSVVKQHVGDVDVAVISDRWEDIMAIVKPLNFSVEALLRAARPTMIEGDTLIMEVAYTFHLDKLQESASQHVIEDALQQVLGKKMRVECRLSGPSKHKDGKPRTVEAEMVPAPLPKKPQAAGKFGGKKVSDELPVESEEDEELLKFAEDIFGK